MKSVTRRQTKIMIVLSLLLAKTTIKKVVPIKAETTSSIAVDSSTTMMKMGTTVDGATATRRGMAIKGTAASTMAGHVGPAETTTTEEGTTMIEATATIEATVVVGTITEGGLPSMRSSTKTT